MFRLFVKGTREQAIEAARARGFNVKGGKALDHGQSLVVIRDAGEGAHTRVASWFAEAPSLKPGEGFPTGTLLFFADVADDRAESVVAGRVS